uniref:Uncharacterized protein n=1 Tax=Ciona intestinalis TaxID=7719 RepID=F6QIG1_CIOIN
MVMLAVFVYQATMELTADPSTVVQTDVIVTTRHGRVNAMLHASDTETVAVIMSQNVFVDLTMENKTLNAAALMPHVTLNVHI